MAVYSVARRSARLINSGAPRRIRIGTDAARCVLAAAAFSYAAASSQTRTVSVAASHDFHREQRADDVSRFGVASGTTVSPHRARSSCPTASPSAPSCRHQHGAPGFQRLPDLFFRPARLQQPAAYGASPREVLSGVENRHHHRARAYCCPSSPAASRAIFMIVGSGVSSRAAATLSRVRRSH